MLIQPTLDTLNQLKLHGMALGLSEQLTHGAAQTLAFEERLDPFKPKSPDPRRYRRRQDLSGLRSRAPSLPPGLERLVRTRTTPVRGTQPLPRRRQLPQT